MPKKAEKSADSVWRWMFTILMIAIPCFGFLYTFIGAFYSTNESRRNFYRAHLAWLAIVVGLYASLFVVGAVPDIRKLYRQYQHEKALEMQKSISEDSGATESHKVSKKIKEPD